MIDLYAYATSNGQRAAIMLEECGLAYRVHRVDLAKGEQRSPEFLRLNPAGAIPVIVDDDASGGRGQPLLLAQSGAIMLYCAEKTGKFLPRDPARRALALQWLMQALSDVARASSGVFMSSMLVPDKSPANVEFFSQLTVRYFRDADVRLRDSEYLAGELSLADFALYPIYAARKDLITQAGDLPDLTRWADGLAARSGVSKGMDSVK